MKADLDLVLLSWNRSAMTIEAIQNVKSQIGVTTMVWIIDQGSHEKDYQHLDNYVRDDPLINLIRLEKNVGVAAGRNLGMSLGDAEYIACIDNDAEFAQPNALRMVVDKFDLTPNLAVIGFLINKFNDRSLDTNSWAYPRLLIEKRFNEFKTTRFCGAGHAIRRSALGSTLGYDEKLFFYWEELDLAYQLINNGHEIIFFPQIEVLHKISDEMRTFWKNDRYYYLVRNALYLEWKYYRHFSRFVIRAIGYLIKGVINGVLLQSLRALFDTRRLISQIPKHYDSSLTLEAKKYIYRYDEIYRGSFFRRLRSEVLAKLPK